ncbi:hypothetical protein B0H13DRAFT_2432002 [Mycena leptocephala]|nr:hypothetical protein B0H13DRAFT_2432002 [Mycena leptocephala]
MVIDENRKGVPVAFLMFSAPTGNKQSSAGYDTAILTKLIRNGATPSLLAGTSTPRWGGLLPIYRHYRYRLERAGGLDRSHSLNLGKDTLKVDLKHRLKRLEDSLVKTQTIEEARELLAGERELITQFGERRKPIRKALEHLDYLRDYWTTDNLWKSWSDYGRKVAASLLGCEMDGVRLLPGGANLLKNRSAGRQIIPKIAYQLPDEDRDLRAQKIFDAGQVGVPTFEPTTNAFVFPCLSTEALEIEATPVQYTVRVGIDGVVTCTCLDFEKKAIPIPSSLTEAHALQTKTVIKRAETSATSSERPTVRAAAAVADLLREDESCTAVNADAGHNKDDVLDGEIEDEDVDTDASSDSGDDDDEEDSARERASGNLAALGEQALARTIYELDEIGPRAGDLAEFLKRKSGPVSAAEQECLSRGRGHLAAMLAEIDRILFSAESAPMLVLTQSLVEAKQKAAPTASQNGTKRQPNRTLHAPSPERAQKRHQSYAAH